MKFATNFLRTTVLTSSIVGPSSNTLGFYVINDYRNFNLTRKIFLNINIKLKTKQLS